MLSNLARAFVIVSAILVVFLGVGACATALISLWYVDSPNYCRDCDTGIGICGIAYGFSLLATPFIVFAFYRFIRRKS